MSSLQTRAHAVSTTNKLSYQECFEGLRRLGALPRRLAGKAGWSLDEADVFYAKSGFDEEAVDPELEEILKYAVYIRTADCENECGLKIIYGLDKKGMETSSPGPFCYRCRREAEPCTACGADALSQMGLCPECESRFHYQMAKD